MKKSKRIIEASKLVDSSKAYEIQEAVNLALQTATAKFDESLELHIKLGVDARHADQQVRGVVVLPHGTGKAVKVLVIAKDLKADEAVAAGADYVGGEELINKIKNENWLDFDICVTTPDMMGMVSRVAKILGPKGLMPNPKSGTVTPDVTKAIKEIKAGKVEYRLDKNSVIHVSFGKKSFGAEKLIENYQVLLDAIIKAKPASAKGQYLRSVYIASTMGLGIKVASKM